MTNPGNLIAGVVAAYRSIPELVAEHLGDSTRIDAYLGFYPENPSLARAVYQMRVPGTLVVYQGFSQGTRGFTWNHRLSVFHRMRPSNPADTAPTYLSALWLLVNGTPTGQSQRLIDFEFHPDYDTMQPPTLIRQTMVVDQAGTSIDYFELQMQIPEKGDY